MEAPAAKVSIPRNGVDYRGKIVLAPMVRSGELPSRLLALKYGADLVWGPETIDRSMIGTTRRECSRTETITFSRYSSNGIRDPALNPTAKESVLYRIHPKLESRRLIFQMGTSSPTTAIQAGRLIAADVAGIDVNAGCPKPFSTSGGMGAALLKTPDKLCAILEALVEEVGKEFAIGISVKIRILSKPEDTEMLVRKLVKTGITGLTVHCRTTPMRPRERAIRDQLRMIANLCREAGVACLMNGDVESRDQAVDLIKEYGVDGAMIATAAEKNSSVFRASADGGLAPWEEVVREYVTTALAVENRWANTKFLLAQLIPGYLQCDLGLSKWKSHAEVVLGLGLDNLLVKAQELDDRLQLNRPELSRIVKRAAAREGRKAEKQNEDEDASARKMKVENLLPDVDGMAEDLERKGLPAIVV